MSIIEVTSEEELEELAQYVEDLHYERMCLRDAVEDARQVYEQAQIELETFEKEHKDLLS